MSEDSVATTFWLWQFLGRLHPLVVHFPISLLIVALVIEIYSWKNKNQPHQTSQQIVLLLGALSAILAAVFGFLLKYQDEYSGSALAIHQWSGIATAVLAATTYYFFRLFRKNNSRQLLNYYRVTLIFSVIGVCIAGHYGASLTHGSDYLTEVLPWNEENSLSGNPDFNLASISNDSSKVLSSSQVAALNLEV